MHVPALYFALNIPQIYPQQRVYDRFMAVRWYIDRASKELNNSILPLHMWVFIDISYMLEKVVRSALFFEKFRKNGSIVNRQDHMSVLNKWVRH